MLVVLINCILVVIVCELLYLIRCSEGIVVLVDFSLEINFERSVGIRYVVVIVFVVRIFSNDVVFLLLVIYNLLCIR